MTPHRLLTPLALSLLAAASLNAAPARCEAPRAIDHIEVIRSAGYREPVSFYPNVAGPKDYELWLGDPLESIAILVAPEAGDYPTLRVEQQVIHRLDGAEEIASPLWELEPELEDCYRFTLSPIPAAHSLAHAAEPEAVRVRVSVLEGERWRVVEAVTFTLPVDC